MSNFSQFFFFLSYSDDSSIIIPTFWAHYLNIIFTLTFFFSCYQLKSPAQTLSPVTLVMRKCLVSVPSLCSQSKLVLQVALTPQYYHGFHLYVCNVKPHALKCQLILSSASASISCLALCWVFLFLEKGFVTRQELLKETLVLVAWMQSHNKKEWKKIKLFQKHRVP